MYVDSYLEIFTTMYGWAFANIISSIIIGTGLVVVPFFVILFRQYLNSKEQGLQNAGILSLIEAAQTRLVVALFVAITCFFSSSATSLTGIDLVHQPRGTLLDPNPQEVSKDKGTNSGYEYGMTDAKKPDNISPEKGLDRVPLWWFSVMAISSGVNNAVRGGLSNFENPMREIQQVARLSTIENPDLKRAATAFYSQCYKPAKEQFNPGALSANGQKMYETKKDDVSWFGSLLYLTEPGYYDTLRINDLRPFSVEANATAAQGAGQGNAVLYNPTCKEMWEGYGSQKGLLYRLAEHTRPAQDIASMFRNGMQRFATNVWNPAIGRIHGQDKERELTDAIVRGMLEQTSMVNMTPNVDSSDIGTYGVSKAIDNTAATVAGTFGLTVQTMKADVWRQPLLTGLPMAQALLLMGIYAFLPLAVFLSGYDLRALFMGTVAVFTVKMFASMWTIAQWIDAKLVMSMYPDTVGQWLKLIERPDMALLDGYKASILNTLLVGLLIGLPMLWVSMMGWLGIRINAAAFGLMAAAESTAKKTADSTAAAAGTVIKIGANKALGKK